MLEHQQDPRTGLYLRPRSADPDKTWQCRSGHRWTGAPFRLQMKVDGKPMMETGALCPLCFRAFLEKQFSAHEVVEGEREPSPVRRVGVVPVQQPSRAQRRKGRKP